MLAMRRPVGSNGRLSSIEPGTGALPPAEVAGFGPAAKPSPEPTMRGRDGSARAPGGSRRSHATSKAAQSSAAVVEKPRNRGVNGGDIEYIPEVPVRIPRAAFGLLKEIARHFLRRPVVG